MRRETVITGVWCVVLVAGVALGAAVVSGDTHQDISHTAEVDECTAAYDLINGRHDDPDGPTVSIAATAPEPGVVSLEYTVPDDQESFSVSVWDHKDIRHVEGFEEPFPGYFEYAGGDTARIKYAVNRSFQIPGSIDSENRPASYTSHDQSVATTTIPEHDGAPFQLDFPDGGQAGTSIMYVGPIDRVETMTNGPNRHHVVIPSAADSSAGKASIEGLELGAESLEPRHYYCESTLFLHPADVRGYAAGADSVSGDNWQVNDIRVHTPLHEYVHLNQRYTLADDMEWFTEGSATYLTARILYDNDVLTAAEYDAQLTYWTRHSSGSDLTDPDSYLPESRAVLDRDDYTAGSLVLAQLDADLRTNGDATVYDLFTAVGSGDPTADYDVSAFHDDYERLGGTRSEAELRTLLEEPDTAVEPVYTTPSARVLPDSLTRYPGYSGLSPREIETGAFLLSIAFAVFTLYAARS